MEAVKGSIYILSLLTFLFGCKRYNTSELEDFFHLPLSDKIEFLKVDEQWNDFNGDGEKVVVFKIKSKEINAILKSARENDFKVTNIDIDEKIFTARQLKYIKGEVLYKTIHKPNETNTVAIDSLNGILTYFVGIQ